MERMTDEEYVAIEGSRCPYCRSENIMGEGSIDVDGLGASQEIQCHDCDRFWYDTYALSGYMDPEG